jgi:hypothetical protein
MSFLARSSPTPLILIICLIRFNGFIFLFENFGYQWATKTSSMAGVKQITLAVVSGKKVVVWSELL